MRTANHEIAIPAILEVGRDKLGQIGQYLVKSGISRFVIFFGEGIRELFGQQVLENLKAYEGLKLLGEYDNTGNTMDEIMATAFSLPAQTEAVVGIGGGKVLDVAKYIAFLNNLPFISVPTSAAHDGFASSGCSLYIHGRRTSVPARIPYGIIVDIGVIKAAPVKYLYSGLGDIISKITAVYDWLYEEEQGLARVDDFAVMMAKKSVNSIARMPYNDIQEDFFVKELVDSLTMSGIAMEIAGNSAPASGSEHLISHALDKFIERPQLHGIQVGIATYIMSKVQNHRYPRVRKFLTDTGFFAHVKTLGLKASDYEKAVDLAPSIKPNRRTTIHVPENRELAKRIIREDDILREVFIP